jgi:peptidoglycan hydrolase-like protein with peptidoglycan-binding domain
MKWLISLILVLCSGVISANDIEIDRSKGYVVARLVGYTVQDNYYPRKRYYKKKVYYKKRYYPKKKVYRKKYTRPAAKRDTYRYVPTRTSNEKKIQMALSALGFYQGAIDGSLHSYETRMAIKKMNETYGIGSRTLLSADAKSTLIFLSTLFDFDKKLIAPDSGTYMKNKKVQAALKVLGFYHGRIDGSMGRNTRNATAEYKRSMGLSPSSYLSYEEERQLVDRAKKVNDKNIADAIESLKETAIIPTSSS